MLFLRKLNQVTILMVALMLASACNPTTAPTVQPTVVVPTLSPTPPPTAIAQATIPVATSAPAVTSTNTRAPSPTRTLTRTPPVVNSATATLIAATATFVPPTATRRPSATSTAPATPKPIPTIASLPTLQPTPGAITRARCGNFVIEQQVGVRDGIARGARIAIRNPQGQIVRTFTATVEFFESVEALYCGDLTGDGAPEVVISAYSGGAHCCFTYDIVSLKSGIPSVLHWEAGNGGINRFALLTGRLPYEIVGSDDRFAYFADLPYAASPFLPIVFAYRNGKYVNATRDFPQLVRDNQAEVRQELANCAGDEFCEKSFALHVYADGVLLNQEAQTLAQLKTQVQPSVFSWLNQHRSEILKALSQ